MIEVFDDKTAFLEALHGRASRKTRRTPSARPGASGESTDVSTIERSERTGLTSLLLAGWNVAYDGRMRMRLWRGALDTGFYDDERACCDEAKRLVSRALSEQESGE